MKTILDKDVDTTEIYHDVEGGCVIETKSNISRALVERNRQLRNSGVLPEGLGMRYVGSVDPVEFMKWCKEDPEFTKDPKKLFRKLADPDYRDFLVVDRGRL